MEDDKLLPHVENLVPGFLTLFLMGSLVPSGVTLLPTHPQLVELAMQPVIAALMVVAAAYLLGAVVFVASRLVVDTISRWSFRLLLLRLFDPCAFRKMSLGEINRKYLSTLNKALKLPEIEKRRQRGRLIRTSIVPVVVATTQTDYPYWATLAGVASVVFLYAYAEVSVYNEAVLAASQETIASVDTPAANPGPQPDVTARAVPRG